MRKRKKTKKIKHSRCTVERSRENDLYSPVSHFIMTISCEYPEPSSLTKKRHEAKERGEEIPRNLIMRTSKLRIRNSKPYA